MKTFTVLFKTLALLAVAPLGVPLLAVVAQDVTRGRLSSDVFLFDLVKDRLLILIHFISIIF